MKGWVDGFSERQIPLKHLDTDGGGFSGSVVSVMGNNPHIFHLKKHSETRDFTGKIHSPRASGDLRILVPVTV